jgi:hypothetical protein
MGGSIYTKRNKMLQVTRGGAALVFLPTQINPKSSELNGVLGNMK